MYGKFSNLLRGADNVRPVPVNLKQNQRSKLQKDEIILDNPGATCCHHRDLSIYGKHHKTCTTHFHLVQGVYR